MTSFLSCSKRESDLLTMPAKRVEVEEQTAFSNPQSTVQRKNLHAPRNESNFAPHELVTEKSRMTPKVSSFLEGQRMVGGTAHTEKLIIDLNAAAQLNRGPPGIFESSRTHLDMLLGRDESISIGDYLNFDSKF